MDILTTICTAVFKLPECVQSPRNFFLLFASLISRCYESDRESEQYELIFNSSSFIFHTRLTKYDSSLRPIIEALTYKIESSPVFLEKLIESPSMLCILLKEPIIELLQNPAKKVFLFYFFQ